MIYLLPTLNQKITVMKNLFFCLLMAVSGLMYAQQAGGGIENLYSDYLKIKDALTADNSAKAASAANDFVKTLGSVESKLISSDRSAQLKKAAQSIGQSKDIKVQRNSFYSLSDNMVELAKAHKIKTGTIYVQYCPMAKGQWLSSKEEIKNPYYGKSMLECGYVSTEIK